MNYDSGIKEKEAFVENEFLDVLRRANKDVLEAWFEVVNGREYVMVEFCDGDMKAIDVTGCGTTALTLKVIEECAV